MRSERVFLVSVAIVVLLPDIGLYALMPLAALCRRTLGFTLRAQSRVFLCDPLRRKLRDVYRRHLVAILCVIVL